MRTTLTLDPDVALKVKERVRQGGSGLKAVINDALRVGLGLTPPEAPARFKVEPHSFGLRPGFDPDRLNQLVDELETDEAAGKLGP